MDSPEPALARWLAQGVSSRTHPVLRWALRAHFHPLGIDAEALEAEPFSALESGLGEWWLHRPRWDAGRVDRGHPAAQDFGPLLDAPACYTVAVDRRGLLLIGLNSEAPVDSAARAFGEGDESGWRLARHAVRAAHDAEAFIYGAAGLILAGDPAVAIYAAGDDAAFCRAVGAKLLNGAGEAMA
jgi:hypothetical protein